MIVEKFLDLEDGNKTIESIRFTSALFTVDHPVIT